MRRLLVITTLLCASSVVAQAQEDAGKMLKASRTAMKKLVFLSGKWGGIETYPKSDMLPKGGKYRASIKTTKLYKGLHLLTKQVTSMRPKYEATGIWSYDARKQEYVLSWFDTMGGHSQYRGKFSNGGKELTMARRAGEMQFNLHWKFHDPHHYTFTMNIQKGETGQTMLTGEYGRSGKGPRMLQYTCGCGKEKHKPLGAKAPS